MRKEIFICIAVFFLSGSNLTAQIFKSAAIKPGISLTKQIWYSDNNDYGEDNTYYAGIYVGMNAEFLHHEWMSILAEAGFTMRSHQKTYWNYQSLDYIYLSPLFKVRKEFGKLIPYVFIGPRIDFLLTPKSEEVFEPKEYLNKVVFGFIYGLAMEYKFSKSGIALGFHQQYDFTNTKDGTLYTFKQNTFVIFLEYKVYFNKKTKSQ